MYSNTGPVDHKCNENERAASIASLLSDDHSKHILVRTKAQSLFRKGNGYSPLTFACIWKEDEDDEEYGNDRVKSFNIQQFD